MPYFQLDDTLNVYYELSGRDDAPNKVLCVMGLATNHKVWEYQMKYFGSLPSFQICVFDHRGSGFSSAPEGPYTIEQMAQDVISVADRLKWNTFHLVGTSMGGMISQRVSLLIPDRIASLSLLCTRITSSLWNSLPSWRILSTAVKQILFRQDTWQVNYQIDMIFSPEFLSQLCTEEEEPNASAAECSAGVAESGAESAQKTESVRASRGKMTNRDYYQQKMLERRTRIPISSSASYFSQLNAVRYHHVHPHEIEQLNNQRKFKVLIIHGDQDLVISCTNAHTAHSLLPDVSSLIVIKGAGHALLEECKEKVNAELRSFMESAKTQA